MSFVDRPVSQPEKLGGSMSERLTREQVERWYERGTAREIQLARDLLALMDDIDRLRAERDWWKELAEQAMGPEMTVEDLRAALAVPEGETK